RLKRSPACVLRRMFGYLAIGTGRIITGYGNLMKAWRRCNQLLTVRRLNPMLKPLCQKLLLPRLLRCMVSLVTGTTGLHLKRSPACVLHRMLGYLAIGTGRIITGYGNLMKDMSNREAFEWPAMLGMQGP
ncbi:hypothetical protein SQ11_11100, partial [Nitrosospira sp. NpAV]